MSRSQDDLCQFMSTQNAEVSQFHTNYYQYLVEAEKTDSLSLEEHLRKFGTTFSPPMPASDEQLAAVEKNFGVTLPDDLVEFYRTLGLFEGQDAAQLFVCTIYSCHDLLKCFHSERVYECLRNLGLPYGIRHSWGNSRPEMTRGDGLSEEQCDRLSDAYTWFGYICDGSYESGLHFTFDTEQRYCLFYWHQDEAHSDLSPDLIYKGSLVDLLQSCVEGFLAVREMDEPEEDELPSGDFDLHDLVLWLQKKYED